MAAAAAVSLEGDGSLMGTRRKNQSGRGGASRDPELLRRLLRAKDRMDAASHEEWPVRRLARVSGVSEAHFARSFKQAFGLLAAKLGSAHEAQHQMMECLGEMIWASQRSGLPPDGQAYLECVRRRATR